MKIKLLPVTLAAFLLMISCNISANRTSVQTVIVYQTVVVVVAESDNQTPTEKSDPTPTLTEIKEPEIKKSDIVLDDKQTGHVQSDGAVGNTFITGMYNGLMAQALLSFDISGIPHEAIITKVETDFNPCEIQSGDPFSLGDESLHLFLQNYGTPDAGDFQWYPQIEEEIYHWGDYDSFAMWTPIPALAKPLQDALQRGDERLQLNLLFLESEDNPEYGLLQCDRYEIRMMVTFAVT